MRAERMDRLVLDGRSAPEIYLETERLILRWLTEDDEADLFELDSDPAVVRYLTGGVPHTRKEIASSILPRYLSACNPERGLGFFAAIERVSGDLIGWFHLRRYPYEPSEVELGYRLRQSAWGRGVATEGALALIDHGFSRLGVSKIVADTLAANVRSRRVMEKLGMTLESEFVCEPREFPGWSEQDRRGVKYALLAKDYDRSRHGG